MGSWTARMLCVTFGADAPFKRRPGTRYEVVKPSGNDMQQIKAASWNIVRIVP